MKDTIQLAGILLPEHHAALSDYLRGTGRLTRTQWQRLREAIDLLAKSTVTVQERAYSFTQLTRRLLTGSLPRCSCNRWWQRRM